MDPEVGDLPNGDVLVEGERIAAIGARLAVDDAEVLDARGCLVLPGLIDTHRHTWQTQLRGLCADWTLDDYFLGIRLTMSPAYSAEDVWIGNYLGALEALDTGVTTILDFSHCNNSPDHADAAVRGLQEAGIRALFAYGFFASSPDHPAFPTHDARLADFERVARMHAGGLVTVGAALTEVGLVPWSDTVAEIQAARAASARMIAHTGCVWGSSVTRGIREMAGAGLLGSDQVHVHCNALDDDEWSMLARAGAHVSISPETELNMGMGGLVFGKCRALGIRPTVSCDIISLNSGDLFTQLRMGIAHQRFADNDPINQSGAMPRELTWTAREALGWATMNGAVACGLDGVIGSLRRGKQADLVVVGGDSFTQWPGLDAAGSLVFQTSARDVRTVLVAGRIVKRDGALVGIDRSKLGARAEQSARDLIRRARRSGRELPPAVRRSLEAVST
jgi:cytosine/adenosine deaminase-related metal-dependent hydrolase